MSVYPDMPAARTRAIARDALVLLLLIAFAWLGIRAYHTVDKLTSLGTGVAQAGLSVRSGFSSAASAVDSVPLAGGALAGALRDAGNATGGSVAAVGQEGAHSAHHVAVLLGLLIWALPSALLLVLVLPRRIAEARTLLQMRRAARSQDAAQRRLLAVRAVLTLPDEDLFSRTSDPGGDLLAGRYDALAAAELEANGVLAPTVVPDSGA